MQSEYNPRILVLVNFISKSYWHNAFENMFLAELTSSNYHIELFEILNSDPIDLNLRLSRKLEIGRFDIVLTSETNNKIFHSTLDLIKSNAKSLLFVTDNALVPFQHRLISKYFDLVWLLDNQNVQLFKKWSANIIHLPWAGNRLFALNSCSYNNQISRVLFIGTPYGSRIKQINVLLSNKIPVTIYSSKIAGEILSSEKNFLFPLMEVFRQLKLNTGRKIIMGKILSLFYNDKLIKNEYLEIFPSVEVSEMIALYKKYRLSWSSVYARNTGYLKSPLVTINVRSFEIPISGGLQFVVRNDELDKYFSDGHDIVFYDKENFVDIARQYLFELCEEKIVQMKKNAQRNALMNHTWENRFKKIFDILDI